MNANQVYLYFQPCCVQQLCWSNISRNNLNVAVNVNIIPSIPRVVFVFCKCHPAVLLISFHLELWSQTLTKWLSCLRCPNKAKHILITNVIFQSSHEQNKTKTMLLSLFVML